MADPRYLLSTIGYEGACLEDFIATLVAADIRYLVDVRELPISRRKGFAKTALSEALGQVGIEYVHLKGLGDPKEGREAARLKDFSTFHKIFANHMESEAAKADLAAASRIAVTGGACLMCFERDPHTCHRTLVAHALGDNLRVVVRHLGVRVGLAKRNRSSGQAGARESSSPRQGATARR
jgi:uncharacterized protein (DUF488 family)